MSENDEYTLLKGSETLEGLDPKLAKILADPNLFNSQTIWELWKYATQLPVPSEEGDTFAGVRNRIDKRICVLVGKELGKYATEESNVCFPEILRLVENFPDVPQCRNTRSEFFKTQKRLFIFAYKKAISTEDVIQVIREARDVSYGNLRFFELCFRKAERLVTTEKDRRLIERYMNVKG